MFAVVQLSDLHFKEGKNPLQGRIGQLAAAISSTDPNCTYYFIVLSGDVAWQAIPAEYTEAKLFLDSLARAIFERQPAARIEYVAIPGNHDCYLPESEIGLRDALVTAIQPTLQTANPDASILQNLLDRQNSFFSFYGDLGSVLPTTAEKLCTYRVFTIGANRVQFNLYNTALLSTRSEKQGQLFVPMEMIRSKWHFNPDRISRCQFSIIHTPGSKAT